MSAFANRATGGHCSLSASGVSETGMVRATNEDCFAIDPDLSLLVVADGMGGHNAGEVAARVAVDAVVGFMRQARRTEQHEWPFGHDDSVSDVANLLCTSVHEANLRVLEAADAADEYLGMGTTIVAAVLHDTRLSMVHVGDSRGYLFANRQIRQLTRDDSWIMAMLAQDPTTDPATLQRHPMRNALTNVVGASRSMDVHVSEETVSRGSLVALTTDGVHGVVDEISIGKVLAVDGDVAELARQLVQEALGRGSRDNCTAVVGRCLVP